MSRYPRKLKTLVNWSPPQQGIQKFNVNGASRGKLGRIGVGVLRDHNIKTSLVFMESVGLRLKRGRTSSIKRALTTWKVIGQGKLVIEGNSTNAIKWTK